MPATAGKVPSCPVNHRLPSSAPVVLSAQQNFVYDTGRAVLLRSGRGSYIVAGVLEQREQSIEGVV
jgi:hypothetical protein